MREASATPGRQRHVFPGALRAFLGLLGLVL